MKNLFLGIIVLLIISSFTSGLNNSKTSDDCSYDKDAMVVVMRFERKIKPEYVVFFKQSFDACKTEVIEKEPGCLDYSLF